jgi:hypothetical protein
MKPALGACNCGCGRDTGVYTRTNPKRGHRKGDFRKFMKGHGRIKPINDRRFEEYVSVEPMTGCWLWLGHTLQTGYGSCWFMGKFHNAHRIAWILYRGKIPYGINVLHTCDTRSCVNPHHLFLGTQSDNMKDCVRKGRNGCSGYRGALLPQTKLSEEQVYKIRLDVRSQREIAKDYGVCQAQIGRIKMKQRWGYLT